MIEVSERIVLESALEDVWAVMDDPHSQPEISPSISAVRNVQQDAAGKSLDYTFRMAGIPIEGHMLTSVYEPRERVVFDLQGPLAGQITWKFEQQGPEETAFSYAAAYSLPSRVLESVVSGVARRYNRRELVATLENLRARVETAE